MYQSFFTEALFVKLLTKAKYVYTKSNHQWENHPFAGIPKRSRICFLATGEFVNWSVSIPRSILVLLFLNMFLLGTLKDKTNKC